MKNYKKLPPRKLVELTGMSIKDISLKLKCRRESIYYACGKVTKSYLREKIEELIREREVNG